VYPLLKLSRSARKNQIEQYICNETNFGTFLYLPKSTSLQNEKEIFSNILAKNSDIINYSKESIVAKESLYSIAQKYRESGQLEKALSAFEEFSLERGSPEEIYNSLLQIAYIQDKLNLPPSKVVQSYERAYHYDTTRCDALYHLSQYYAKIDRNQDSYRVAVEGLKLVKPISNNWISNNWINEFGMALEYSLAAHRLGKFHEAIDATLKLLNNPKISPDLSTQLKKNLQYYYPGVEILSTAEKKWGPLPSIGGNLEKRAIEKFTPRKFTPKLHICTFASDYNQNLKQLLITCKHFGCDIDILGLGQPFSFGNRLRENLKYLEKIDEGDIVLFLDAYDTLLLADTKTIIEKFKEMDAPCVIGAEIYCHPFPHLAPYFPTCASKFKYLNSGCIIGYAGYLRRILEDVMPIPDKTDDQGVFEVYYLYHPHKIKLDYDAKLFLNLYQVEPSEIDIIRQDKKVFCNQNMPLVIHGNGISKYLYQAVFESLYQDPLEKRISPQDKRFITFKKAFELMEERRVKTIVETGTARYGANNFEGDGGSTILFSDWASSHEGCKVYSVDISKECIKAAEPAVAPYQKAVSLICSDSVDFLKNFNQKIDFLYLDSYDFDSTNPSPSQYHHLKEIEAAYDKLTSRSIVMIDDCRLPYGGKGKLVIEYLLQRGWKILEDQYQVILIKED